MDAYKMSIASDKEVMRALRDLVEDEIFGVDEIITCRYNEHEDAIELICSTLRGQNIRRLFSFKEEN